jgi:Secretory lipase
MPSVPDDAQNGDLLTYRPAAINLGAEAPAFNAWNVIYQSKDGIDSPAPTSGTVFVPKTAWKGNGPRPVILYAVGTHGLAEHCAPSRQFELGTDYEAANIVAALKAGYTVLVSDYQGYLDGTVSTYITGRAQGHAVLDMFKAATAIPDVGIDPQSPIGIWGFSQGGQSAAWAGELLPTYAPGLNVKGVAAGGIPSDLIKVSKYLDGSIGFNFMGMAIIGLSNHYPDEMPVNLILSEAGTEQLQPLQEQCLFKTLFKYQNKKITEYTLKGRDIDSLLNFGSVKRVIQDQLLGRNKMTVPLYQFHGQADEFIPLDQSIELRQRYCDSASDVTFDLYPSEHVVTLFQAAPTVLNWMSDRFAGKPTASTCGNTAPAPVTNANPGGGNLVVTLKSWQLNGALSFKKLNQSVTLPPLSTFSADSDVTAQSINNANLIIPNFKAPIRVAGLPVTVRVTVTQAEAPTGTVSLDEEGQLHVHGKARMNLTASLGFVTCKTSAPIEFPLDFDGPISSLGNGKLTFSGTTAIPKMTGCGKAFSPIMSSLMSGAAQGYTFTIKPTAPIKY